MIIHFIVSRVQFCILTCAKTQAFIKIGRLTTAQYVKIVKNHQKNTYLNVVTFRHLRGDYSAHSSIRQIMAEIGITILICAKNWLKISSIGSKITKIL